MILEWPKLLCQLRVGQTCIKDKSATDRSAFEEDYDRVVFCEPFRRLAKKTQVHPLAPNDHIHNRLIHSIEVGSVGRSLGNKIQPFLVEQHPDDKSLFDDIAQIIQVGCLIHDIGNPPFGHAGENTIREWLAKHEELVFDKHVDTATRNDLLLFEGNAQGFRLASRVDNPKCGYMRLTYASLGSMIKYPWTSDDERAREQKKFNVFESEKEIFQTLANEMGLLRSDGTVARHPLSFLTEASDDICYRMLDMEDAVSMRIFDEKPIKKLFLDIAGEKYQAKMSIGQARGKAIGTLIEETCRVFIEDYQNIISGNREKDLKSSFSEKNSKAFNKVKNHYNIIFSHRSKLGYEIGSYKMLGRIIKAFVLSAQSLRTNRSYDKLDFISQRCLDLAWDKQYINRNAQKPYEWWLRQIFDFVSGLTDNYAIQISGEIEGILTP